MMERRTNLLRNKHSHSDHFCCVCGSIGSGVTGEWWYWASESDPRRVCSEQFFMGRKLWVSRIFRFLIDLFLVCSGRRRHHPVHRLREIYCVIGVLVSWLLVLLLNANKPVKPLKNLMI
jgi:hypothetical protein